MAAGESLGRQFQRPEPASPEQHEAWLGQLAEASGMEMHGTHVQFRTGERFPTVSQHLSVLRHPKGHHEVIGYATVPTESGHSILLRGESRSGSEGKINGVSANTGALPEHLWHQSGRGSVGLEEFPSRLRTDIETLPMAPEKTLKENQEWMGRAKQDHGQIHVRDLRGDEGAPFNDWPQSNTLFNPRTRKVQ